MIDANVVNAVARSLIEAQNALTAAYEARAQASRKYDLAQEEVYRAESAWKKLPYSMRNEA